MIRLTAALLVVLFTAAPALAADDKIRIAVVTVADPSGLVDKPTEERLKAVADMKKRLSANKDVAIVERREEAQAVIEVMQAGAEEGGPGISTVHAIGSVAVVTPPAKTWEFVGRATLTSGTFTTNFEASIGPFGRTYGENLARKVEDWLKKNVSALRSVPTTR